jgi:serine/threonine protein kinase
MKLSHPRRATGSAPRQPAPAEEVLDLSDEAVEEPPEAAEPPPASRSGRHGADHLRRHRRPTLRSPIPAQLAESMSRIREEDSAIPKMVHDDITIPVGAYPEPIDEETDPDLVTVPWIEVVAEPAPEVREAAHTADIPRRVASLELRGVFRADGAAIAADPTLPDHVFAFTARERTRPWSTSTSQSTSPSPSPSRIPSAAAGAPRRARADNGAAVAPRAGRRALEETLPRGAIIDKYRIDRLLGKGGFAAVYRATHLLLNTQVAIKLLRPQVLARHAHLAKLLYEEARFAARIDHPNVVKVLDVTHTASITYIVMEYIDGRSLADTIARERVLPWPRVVEIGAAVTAGLKVALGARLIHRDIKPANILLGRRGEIKIVDLGLVLRAGALAPEPGERVPAAGRRAAIGTYGYMAPEQAVDPERIDFRADIYALGATLYEAAVGAPPFPLGDPARCLDLHAREAPPPPDARNPSLPPALSALLLRMLAKLPDDRFPSYDALAEALARIAAPPAPGAPH